MRNVLPVLLPRLEAHRLDGLNAGPDAFYPYYQGYSLANLPSSICHWLGLPPFGSSVFGPEITGLWTQKFRQVVLLVVDGLGLNVMQQVLETTSSEGPYAVWHQLAEDAALAPLTSVVPSTTAAALTTFWTGCPPAAHGVVGYEVWLKEYSMIANMILHSPASFYGDVGSLQKGGFNPETFLPVPTLGPHLLQYGVKPYALQHMAIARSGLSTMLFPGVDVRPFRTQSDLWVTLSRLMDATADEQSYIYIYWGDLDDISHRYGPNDERAGLEFANFSQQFRYFIQQRVKKSQQDTLFIVTADHGHIFTPRMPEYEIRNHPDLLSFLTMVPSGEARLPFAYLRSGRERAFLDYLEKTWPGVFPTIPSEEAVRAGLFGQSEIYDRLYDRIGDYVIVPQGDAYWWFGNRDNPLLGRHGGISRTEMLVPFFSFVL